MRDLVSAGDVKPWLVRDADLPLLPILRIHVSPNSGSVPVDDRSRRMQPAIMKFALDVGEEMESILKYSAVDLASEIGFFAYPSETERLRLYIRRTTPQRSPCIRGADSLISKNLSLSDLTQTWVTTPSWPSRSNC